MHSLYCFRVFHTRTCCFIHLFYCQTVASHCLSLTSCEKDALRLFLKLDCHFIRENRLPNLLIDAAEHPAPWLRCERPWGKHARQACFHFNFKTIHAAKVSADFPLVLRYTISQKHLVLQERDAAQTCFNYVWLRFRPCPHHTQTGDLQTSSKQQISFFQCCLMTKPVDLHIN